MPSTIQTVTNTLTPSQYTSFLFVFVNKNRGIFQSNSEIHDFNTCLNKKFSFTFYKLNISAAWSTVFWK